MTHETAAIDLPEIPEYHYVLIDAQGNSKQFSDDFGNFNENRILETLRDMSGSKLVIYRKCKTIEGNTI